MDDLSQLVAQITFDAASIYGAVLAHCDMLDSIRPGMGDSLRKVTTKHYDAMSKHREELYDF